MDTIALIGALEQVLVKSVPQANAEFGAGLVAAQKVYADATHPAAEQRTCLCGRADSCCSLQHADAGGKS